MMAIDPHASFLGSAANSTPLDFNTFAVAVRSSHQNDIDWKLPMRSSSAQAAVSWLIRRKLLVASKKTVTATPSYKVLSPWRSR
jgi:hypothetical protein